MAESRAIIGIETNHAASPVRGAINLHQIKLLANREMEGLTEETGSPHLKTSRSLIQAWINFKAQREEEDDKREPHNRRLERSHAPRDAVVMIVLWPASEKMEASTPPAGGPGRPPAGAARPDGRGGALFHV